MSISRQRLQEKFRAEYQRLNPRQREAVDSIEGPVMVIAGPGTGKTQILASRIGKILLETDSLPENILCLTYTDAGVVAMRKRLLQFIGPDAYKVNIYTFHAFCNEVIQENLHLFRKTELDPVSDLERIEYLKGLIDGLPKNHPLKRYRGDAYYEINNLSQLFSSMKREGWTPQFLGEKIDEYLDRITDQDDQFRFHYKTNRTGRWKAGDPKPAYREELDRMEKLRAAVNEFNNFQKIMEDKGRYDFDDMINWVIRAFETDKNLLARYQEQFLYILVDEYQDTSGTQNRLVELLISYWEKPNIFVVGDDDQSIFRFQGANVENMLQLARAYEKDLLKVVLSDNYRSVQPILDMAQSLIGRNEERLTRKLPYLTKQLVSSNERLLQLNHLPVIREYDNPQQEMMGITLEVESLLQQGTEPGRIAVIFRENRYGQDLSEYFRLRKIPVFSRRSRNILELPLARKLISIFRYLAAEHDIPYEGDELLFEILHYDFFGIPPLEIAKLSVEVADRQFGEKKTSIRRLLFEKSREPARDLFSRSIPESLVKAGNTLEGLIAAVPNVTVQVLFEKIVRETGMLNQVMQSPDKFDQLQLLNGIFDFIREETRRQPLMSVAELVGILDLMEKEGLPLPLPQVDGSEKGVNLITAHGSKGLEFMHVFFAGCNASYWEKKRIPNRGYSFPDTVFATQERKEADEELRRLFFVAMTRAEQHLYLSFSKYRADRKELEPSMFIAEILEQHPIGIESIAIPPDQVAEFAAIRFAASEKPEMAKAEEEFIGRALDNFVLSVTALNNYLRCPLEFYFRNLVRIPSPKNEATEFGSAVHYALEQLFRKMQDSGERIFPGREVFLADFKWYMQRHRQSFTKEQYDRRLEYGTEVLTHYYDKYVGTFNTIVAIERPIRNVTVKGVPIKGKLDKLEFDGKKVNIVDYKTGDPAKAREKLQGPSEKHPDGGDYWRQAVFYKILVDHYQTKDWKAVSTEFDFVEPDKKKQYYRQKLILTPPDIETVIAQITHVWTKVHQRDFYTGCGREDCHWCNFVKTHDLAIALHEVETGEEPEL